MLNFNNISKVFNTDLLKSNFTALKDLNFSIPESKITGYLGANGAGKTTSLKIAMDFIRPTSGSISFDPKLGRKKEEIFKNIGFLPERPFFYPHSTGNEFCHYLGRLTDMKAKDIKERAAVWSKRLSIDHAMDRQIKTYSKGMLQRLGFLVTILHRPKLVILDEPLSGLDPIGRKELKEIIKEIYDDGATVFFSSHIVSDMEEICHDVVFLKDGEIVYNGNIQELLFKNMDSVFQITYRDEKNIITRSIEPQSKNEFLKSLIDNNKDIISVDRSKPSLEEVFYNVK